MSQTLPYIGIVGTASVSEARDVGRIFREHLPLEGLVVTGSLGVQVTDNSLSSKKDNLRCPNINDIPLMFREIKIIYPPTFTTVHFSTKLPKEIFQSVSAIMSVGDMYKNHLCDGVQLNGNPARISVEDLAKIKLTFPDLKIILQIPEYVMQKKSTEDIVNLIKIRQQYIDYALIDPSGGRSKLMNVKESVYLANAISRAAMDVEIVLAGGFTPKNAFRLFRTIRKRFCIFQYVSVDVEGGVRDRVGPGYGNDVFNSIKARTFFENIISAYSTIC